MIVCAYCERPLVEDEADGWVDPEATGDDAIWRTTCDRNDSFTAEHEPVDEPEVVATRWLDDRWRAEEMSHGLWRLYRDGTYMDSLTSLAECRAYRREVDPD